ncbi:MAG: peptidylprolyl isomerase [Pseudomonadota bacterium]|nr:peptidylprolyl isomerase [Pseudomonadota bacterium]MEE3117766.1 peptidylprolyl isomerase [Pseudomonadota bacterium]
MLNSVKQSRSVIPALLLVVAAWLPLTSAHGQDAAGDSNQALPKVRFVTSEGSFVLQLRPDVAPDTVDNFLGYVNNGFYDGTIFHRVIPGFMIQGGGFTEELTRKPTEQPIRNEASQTLRNLRGTIAMARTSAPDSATSQFFINLVDNGFLDAGVRGAGYAVFGKVTEGMGVVDSIAGVKTGQARGMADVPVAPVVIERVSVLAPAK